MCCGAHNAMGYLGIAPSTGEYFSRVIEHHDHEINGELDAATEAERCKCNGGMTDEFYLKNMSYRKACVCLRKIDGEDLRCSVCRETCELEWTPRIMSDAALASLQRAHG